MITIVSGLPRSGTSLMMQMLEAAGFEIATDETREPDTDNPRGYYELDAVKAIRQDDSFLVDVVGKAVKIVAPLLSSLPSNYDYRIVFMERDFDEILASQAAMLLRSGKHSDATADRALRTAYRNQIEKVKDWIAQQPNVTALFVAHRNVIDDPIRVAAAVLEFLDGPASRVGEEESDRRSAEAKRAAMARVVDRSLHRHG